MVPRQWLLHMTTWLLVAAEALEFEGVLRHATQVRPLDWPGARFAREIEWKKGRALLVANGPGPARVNQVLDQPRSADLIVSLGFAGALDPALRIGDIVVAGEIGGGPRGEILSIDRVAVTAAEKQALRRQSGAAVVEMESAAVAAKARAWGIPWACVRSVSDTAQDDMPLDFNRYRDAAGDFSRVRIAMAALMHPFTAMPGLLRLNGNCRIAAEALGDFLANCQS